MPFNGGVGLTSFGDTRRPPAAGQAPGSIAGGMGFAYDRQYGQSLIWCLQQAREDWAVPILGLARFGQGCAGSSGLEPFVGSIGDVPYVGNAGWTPYVMHVGAAQTAFLFLGTGRKKWAGQPLPLDLSFFGLKGCSIWAAWDILVGSMAVSPGNRGAAGMPVPIPKDPVLAGVDIFGQWFLHDPGAAGSFITSPGIGWTLK